MFITFWPRDALLFILRMLLSPHFLVRTLCYHQQNVVVECHHEQVLSVDMTVPYASWNSLLANLRTVSDTNDFKNKLQTCLFKLASDIQ